MNPPSHNLAADPFILGYDFYYFWSAGKLILTGKNFYDPVLLRAQLLQIGWPADSVVPGLPYLPTISWLYALFALVPFEIAKPLWLLMIGGITLFSVWRFILIAREAFKDRTTFPVAEAMWVSMCFPWMIPNIIWGQTNCLVLLAVVLFLEFRWRQRIFLGGFILSLALIKPHLVILLLIASSVRMMREREFAGIFGVISGISIQLILSLIIYPHGFDYYLKFAPNVLQTMTAIPGATLGQNFSYYFGTNSVGFVLFLAGVCGAVYLAIVTKLDWMNLTLLTVSASLLVSPYGWSHGFILLLPWYLVFLGNKFGVDISAIRYLLALIACLGIVVSLQTYLEPLMFVVPLIVTILTVQEIRKNSSSSVISF